MCAPDMLHPFQLGSGLTMTCHDFPTAVYKVGRGWNARTNISKLWILILSATGKKWFRCLFWIAHALKPITARGLAHWRRSRCIDRFLGHQMTHESESVKSSPGPIWYLNQSTWPCRPQVGQIASLAKKSVSYKLRSYPSANLWNPKLKAGVTEVHWSVENKQPFLSLSDSQALQINGATGLLLQVDTGWDKWHCG